MNPDHIEPDQIFIPPLAVVHSSLTFTYHGEDLLVFRNPFDPNVASFLPLLSPVRNKNGMVARRQPRIPDRNMNYWRAQCVFRGLPHTGRDLQPLQKAVRNAADKGMLPEFVEMEKRLKLEFQIKNDAGREEKSRKESAWKEAQKMREQDLREKMRVQAAAREERWKTSDTDYKAEEDPERFLQETFPPGGPKIEAIVVKGLDKSSRHQLHMAAKELHLRTESTDAPKTIGGSSGESSGGNEPKRWMVIGRKTAHVAAKIQDIGREAIRARLQWQEAQDDKIGEAHAKIISKLRRGAGWDVTGSWHIKCPKIENEYDQEGLWLDIQRGQSNGHLHMYGEFDFGILKGVLRFEKPHAGQGGSGSNTVGAKRTRDANDDDDDNDDDDENDNDDEEEEEEEEEEEKKEYNENFYLEPSDKPSPKQPTWNFRWRGNETGEYEIQLYSDAKLCSITFSGPGGCKLNGVFHNAYTRNCTFSGVKVDAEPRKGRCDIAERWSDYNQAAYERARVRRWH